VKKIDYSKKFLYNIAMMHIAWRKFFILVIVIAVPIVANATTEQGAQALRAGDFSTAYKFILPGATAGDANAQFYLCGMYFQGQGVPRNKNESFLWCKLAAEQGHLEAAYNLALFYQKGSGTAQNFNDAMNWYKSAAERGHKNSQFNLLQMINANNSKTQARNAGAGKLVAVVPPVGVALDAQGNPVTMNPLKAMDAAPKNLAQPVPQAAPQQAALQAVQAPTSPAPLTAEQQQQYAAQAGCLQAAQQGIIADNCGAKAVPPPEPAQIAAVEPINEQDTIGWIEKQAELGDLAAQNNLGVMYRRGVGVEKQPEKAFALFEKSAARGSTNGMLNLANMYKLGEGTPQNLELSYSWYNLAADRIPAGEIKRGALANIKEISGYMDNEQIGNALGYVTKLDETIPLE